MQHTTKDCLLCNAEIDVIEEIDENDELVTIKGGYDICGECLGGLINGTKELERTAFRCPNDKVPLIEGYDGRLFCGTCKYKEEL